MQPNDPKGAPSAPEMREYQGAINEATFSQLQEQFVSTNSDVENLETALHMAQTRQRVLAAAIDRLNEPQKAVPGYESGMSRN